MSFSITLYAGGITGAYECRKCGYVGTAIPELYKKSRKKKAGKHA